MIHQKYISLIKSLKDEHLPKHKAFVFGSSLKDRKFRDVDIGVLKQEDELDLTAFKEALEESTFPYLADVVDFREVASDFKEAVLNNEKLLWL